MNDLSRQATRLEAIGGQYDPWLMGAAVALACLGVVMVGSASVAIGESTNTIGRCRRPSQVRRCRW